MINFTKMQAYGNDYIYINMIDREILNLSSLAQKITNRHLGVGGDGLVLIDKSLNADFKMRIFNPDGTEAEMCGNAIRSVAKYVYEKGLTTKRVLKIETLGGIKELKLIIKNDKVDVIETNLGLPEFRTNLIPVKIDKENFINEKVKVLDKDFWLSSLSWGNPHTVTIVEDLNNLDIEKYGPLIENNQIFPKRTNVTFLEIKKRNYLKIREWERGTGETIGCATGCAAAFVIAHLLGLVDYEVVVEQIGGTLEVKLDKETGEVKVIGTTNFVFDGSLSNSFIEEVNK